VVARTASLAMSMALACTIWSKEGMGSSAGEGTGIKRRRYYSGLEGGT
jgi:hypothetical protein